MSSNLVIVESPAKAKTINQYLGKDYIVIASMGHVRDLPSKNGSVIPENDFEMKYEIKKESKKYIDNIIAKAKNVQNIYLAPDPDREGEAIAWNLAEIIKSKKIKSNIKRIVFNEITKSAVIDAIKNARDIDQNLVNAQQARLTLDYLVGFEVSPILWRKLPGSRSAGRVQSVALRLIAEREIEIRKFIPQEYWSIDVLSNFEQKSLDISIFEYNEKKIDNSYPKDKESANKIVSSLQSQKYMIVESLEQKDIKQNPVPPFTTSLLQQEASKKLGFTSKKTMQIAQKLYEGIDINGQTKGLITYMRTDGMSIGNDALATIRKYISDKIGTNYIPKKAILYKTKQKNAQEAHEAIRPTDPSLDPDFLKKILGIDEYKLYRLIWLRTLACQMLPAIKTQTRIDFISENKDAKGKVIGTQIKFDGFLRIYNNKENIEKEKTDNDDQEENLIPILNNGDKVKIEEVSSKQHFTSGPSRYTEATLIKKLEDLGIGRPSTYASIIGVLQDRKYVIINKRQFFVEDLGIIVSAFLYNFFQKYVEYDFTANLEESLDLISNGEMQKLKLLNDFWNDFYKNILSVSKVSIVDIAKKIEPIIFDYSFSNSKELVCPLCNKGSIKLLIGKNGPFFSCSTYPECDWVSGIKNGDKGTVSELHEDITICASDGSVFHIKEGKFGRYAETELPDGTKKRKSIPANFDIKENKEEILKLINLPRFIGINPEDKKEIVSDIGKYGPYVKYNNKFYSIHKDDVFSIDLEKAINIIKQNSSKSNKAKFDHPDGGVITIGKKRGVYALYNKKFYSIKNVEEVANVTLNIALEAIKNDEK